MVYHDAVLCVTNLNKAIIISLNFVVIFLQLTLIQKKNCYAPEALVGIFCAAGEILISAVLTLPLLVLYLFNLSIITIAVNVIYVAILWLCRTKIRNLTDIF